MLSGLLRCGCCGGGMGVKDRESGRVRIVCTTMKESGTCDMRRPFYLDTVERAVLRGLAERLQDRPAIERFVRSYNAERKRLAAEAAGSRGKIEARLQATVRAYDRAYHGYVRGFISEAEAAVSIPQLRGERDAVQAELDAAERPPVVVQLHPEAIKVYLAAIASLEATLTDAAARGDAGTRKTLRDLIERVVVKRPDAEGRIEVEVHGHLSDIVGEKAFPSGTYQGGIAVAGEGLEPPTRGL